MKRYKAFKTQFCDSEQGGDASNPRVAGFKFGPVGGKPLVSEAGKTPGRAPASAGQKSGQPATKKFKDDDDFF